jgi:hypothetical protein
LLCPFTFGKLISLDRGDAGVELEASLFDWVLGTAKVEDTDFLDEEEEASPPISLALLLAAGFELVDGVAADRRDEMVRRGGGPLTLPDPIKGAEVAAEASLASGGGGEACTCEMEMDGC